MYEGSSLRTNCSWKKGGEAAEFVFFKTAVTGYSDSRWRLGAAHALPKHHSFVFSLHRKVADP